MSKVSDLTHIRFEIETSLWLAFKQIAYSQGYKYLKDALKQAIIEYIKNHQTQNQKIQVKIIKDMQARQDLLQFLVEEQIKTRLKEILRAKTRLKQNPQIQYYINELKLKIIEDIKKHPSISQELAQEIKTVFQNLT